MVHEVDDEDNDMAETLTLWETREYVGFVKYVNEVPESTIAWNPASTKAVPTTIPVTVAS